jgi:dienelactone hydrolase
MAGRHTHGSPERAATNELTVRPLDAEGALQWLATRSEDVRRIMLQGWSNGASTALNVMQRQAARPSGDSPSFAAALVFYPGCGKQALLSSHPELDKPVQALLGSADEEVSPATCQRVLRQAIPVRQAPPPMVTVYTGATHDFDDPGRVRQSIQANRDAREEARSRVGPGFGQPAHTLSIAARQGHLDRLQRRTFPNRLGIFFRNTAAPAVVGSKFDAVHSNQCQQERISMTNANAHLHSDLFKPVQLGAVQLQNRIVMAPLTRSRAKAGDVPTGWRPNTNEPGPA